MAENLLRLKEVTKSQTVGLGYGTGTAALTNPLPATYATYRTMRKHPTIALARALSIAPIVAGQWSVEADDEVDEDRIKVIQDVFLGVREPLLETALYGGLDFGWAPFEKIFEQDGGQVLIKKFKPLLHDITKIMVFQDTGQLAGFKQRTDEMLPLKNCLLIPFRVEGTQWHGQSLLENTRAAYNAWIEASEGAKRYDAKIAGSHWVVKYPVGSTDINGTETDNYKIAEDILETLESSGRVAIPNVVAKYLDELDKLVPGWEIILLSDASARQGSFNIRLEYLDKQMVRGILVPERAIIEGRFGTKADAKSHADLALTHMDLQHRHVTRHINWYAVDQILALNYGEESRGTVRLVAAPLSDEMLAYFRELYAKILTNPMGFAEEYDALDTDAMKDTLGIPKSEETGKEPEDENVLPKPSESTNLPVPGVDPNEPLAASVRRLYRKAHG